jgi:hypothetical protein
MFGEIVPIPSSYTPNHGSWLVKSVCDRHLFLSSYNNMTYIFVFSQIVFCAQRETNETWMWLWNSQPLFSHRVWSVRIWWTFEFWKEQQKFPKIACTQITCVKTCAPVGCIQSSRESWKKKSIHSTTLHVIFIWLGILDLRHWNTTRCFIYGYWP